MSKRLPPALCSRFDKVLALVESDQPGEALAALRAARGLLDAAGLSFGDLLQSALKPRLSVTFGRDTGASAVPQELPEAQTMLQAQAALIAAQRRIKELEGRLRHSESEARRWHQVARDSVDTLWEMGSKFLPIAGDTPRPRKSA